MTARAIALILGIITSLLWVDAVGGTGDLAWDGPVTVAEVLAGDQLRLADGRIVRVAGIRVAAADADDPDAGSLAERARDELSTLLDGQPIRLAVAEVPYDRYGRLVAQIEREDGLWLQGALLERGLAQVQTRPGEAERAARMLAIEHSARTARRGLWASDAFAVREAGALDDEVGRFRIIQGRVVRVASTERFAYLNFGADWRTDFTVRIAKDLVRRMADSDLDVTTLPGRRVEIRGFVLEAGGPLIELSHAEQMRVLP